MSGIQVFSHFRARAAHGAAVGAREGADRPSALYSVVVLQLLGRHKRPVAPLAPRVHARGIGMGVRLLDVGDEAGPRERGVCAHVAGEAIDRLRQ